MVTGNCSKVGQRLVIFDLCDTLYDTNTTVGFVQHFHMLQGNGHLDRVVRRWKSKASPQFYIGATAHRLLGRDLAKERIIATLAGKSRTELIEAARDYARSALPGCANRLLHDRLGSHLAAGDHVMLLSSSLDIVVAEIAALLGVEHRGSELGFSGETCTGLLKKDLTGRKSAAIRDLLDAAAEITVYTDNQSDQDLIAIADHATIVVPSGIPFVRWGGSNCEYIRL